MPQILTYLGEEGGLRGSWASVVFCVRKAFFSLSLFPPFFVLIFFMQRDSSRKSGEAGEWFYSELTDVVGPLDFQREVLAAGPIAADAFHRSDGGEVLEEDNGARGSEMGGVVDDGGHDEATGGSNPDVGTSPATGYLGRGDEGEACRELGEERGIPTREDSVTCPV